AERQIAEQRATVATVHDDVRRAEACARRIRAPHHWTRKPLLGDRALTCDLSTRQVLARHGSYDSPAIQARATCPPDQGGPPRTIREHQSLGLLAPPRKVGRIGYYDQSHVDRLAVISRLQQRGYSLAGIGDLIAAWSTGTGLPAVLGLDDAADAATADERPE